MRCEPIRDVPKRDQKIIVLDGPDGCGKTNIAQGLSLEHKIPYFKMPHEKDNWRSKDPECWTQELVYGERRQIELLKQTKMDVVIDRAYPSEWVYSKVFDRYTDIGTLEQCDVAYARMGAYIVIPLRHDYSKCRKDDLVPMERMQEIHDRYLEFTKWTKCSCIVIYTDDFKNDLKWELDMIRRELNFGELMTLPFSTIVTLQRAVTTNVRKENVEPPEFQRHWELGGGRELEKIK